MADLVCSLFDLNGIDEKHLAFFRDRMPWEWLDDLAAYIKSHGSFVREDALKGCYVPDETEGPVFIEPDAIIKAGAIVRGPVYISAKAIVSYGAVVRDGSWIMAGCHVGKGSEVRGSILFPDVVCKRQNYVGDSVIGSRVRLFTGARVSNEPLHRSIAKTVSVRWENASIDTGLQKFGCLIGDGSVIGGGATLSHGAIIGRNCIIQHNLAVSGTIPADSEVIARHDPEVRPREF